MEPLRTLLLGIDIDCRIVQITSLHGDSQENTDGQESHQKQVAERQGMLLQHLRSRRA
jgi:hypothetical protein